MRDQIIAEIQRLAIEHGQAPGQKLFQSETGIAAHTWRGKLWARWGDALAEAGYQPNQWNERLNSDALLNAIIATIRHFGRLPTADEMAIHGKTDPMMPSVQSIRRHFGRRADLVAALAKRAAEDPSCADIATMLPSMVPALPKRHVSGAKPVEGHVYLIKSGGFYKVGRSDELERRVKEIRVALPEKATLIHSIRTDDPPGIETYWHRRFANRRANGEWFKLTSADVAAFRRRTFQ